MDNNSCLTESIIHVRWEKNLVFPLDEADGAVVIQGEAGFEEIQVLSFLLYARAMAIGGIQICHGSRSSTGRVTF